MKSLYVLNFINFVHATFDLIQDKTHVLVTVTPEGFPAKPNVPERQFIIFNIGNFLHDI